MTILYNFISQSQRKKEKGAKYSEISAEMNFTIMGNSL
jgi:hypothetical protein